MFTFFRRYQRVIYFVITAVIIFSFSFFGTYSAFTSGKGEDPVVFRTIEGKRVTRSEFNDYVHFLSTDGLSFGDGGGGPINFLNDGVIPEDIIATGVGEVLVQHFSQVIRGDFLGKLNREHAFQPYRHPQAPFVSALQVWSYFAPKLKGAFEKYRALSSQDPLEIYSAKAALFLAERQFPAAFLRQILAHQQQHGRVVLRGLPGGRLAPAWQAGVVQQRSGFAVHQHSLHRCAQARRRRHQHGRAWSRF